MNPFPELPILPSTPPALPRKTEGEKYGSMLYLGGFGLAVLVGLIAWFGYSLWSMRDVWSAVYVLNDVNRTDVERLDAAWTLRSDPRVNQRQLWDLALSRVPPPAARYLLAESLTSEAATADPRGYGLSVSRSEGWPDWLRLALARPIAYAAVEGAKVDPEPLRELAARPDPTLRLWANAALAGSAESDAESLKLLRQVSTEAGPRQELARLLLRAVESRQPARTAALDEATLWLRTGVPEIRAFGLPRAK